MLGLREPHIYGHQSLDDMETLVRGKAAALGVDVDFLQSNHEGTLIDRLQEARGKNLGVVLNPGGLTHTSVALRDAIKAAELPVVEIHVTNLHTREPFRHVSYISGIAEAVIVGAGILGYGLAVEILAQRFGPTSETAR